MLAGPAKNWDEKELGLLGAAAIIGFWFFVSGIRNLVVTAMALIIWFAFLYWMFYRNAHNEKSN